MCLTNRRPSRSRSWPTDHGQAQVHVILTTTPAPFPHRAYAAPKQAGVYLSMVDEEEGRGDGADPAGQCACDRSSSRRRRTRHLGVDLMAALTQLIGRQQGAAAGTTAVRECRCEGTLTPAHHCAAVCRHGMAQPWRCLWGGELDGERGREVVELQGNQGWNHR